MNSFDNTIFTSNSSVSGERNELTKTVSISARPEITYMYPEIDLVPRAKLGFNQFFHLQGYNFDTVYKVFLSAGKEGKGVYDGTTALSAASAQDLFASLSGLSALYPAFTGRELDSFSIHSRNTISFMLCAAQATGRVDIILINPAGYCTLRDDLSGRTINVVA